ncbi:hypothetical protein T492DRAFT_836691 [Pavlovales sp. CCMP2436]|nr:hypothetical protein T492DRAFT_836691 [Pavlovales sp. CCMP2436]
MNKRSVVAAFLAIALVATASYLLAVSSPAPKLAVSSPAPKLSSPAPKLAVAKAAEGPPMMWATAGGGWRAMAAGMGVARSMHRAGALDSPSLKIASGNSGGAWFLSQFAYSEGFYKDVTGDAPMDQLVVAWMKKQKVNLVVTPDELAPMVKSWLGDNEVATVYMGFMTAMLTLRIPPFARATCGVIAKIGDITVEGCIALIEVFAGGLTTAARTEGSWAFLVESMIKTADPAMATKPATLAARHERWRGPALSFQIANMTHPLVRGGVQPFPAETMRLSATKQLAPHETNPLAFIVPGSSGGPAEVARFETSEIVQVLLNQGCTRDISGSELGASLPDSLG